MDRVAGPTALTSGGTSRRPTMRDVARAAGVSQSLVSIAFRQAPGVSGATRERILATARELGYVRDESARALRAHRSTSIGVCFQTRQPFHHVLLDHLYEATAGGPHQLVLSAVSDARDEATAVEGLLSYRCGALLLLGPRAAEADLAKVVRDTPLVVLGRTIARSDVDWVSSDDAEGIDQAVAHLCELGHRRISYLSCSWAAGGAEREKAFRAAAEAHDVAVGATVLDGDMTEQRGASAAHELLDAAERPTAIIAFNDRVALGLMDVFMRNGVNVPRDMSVIGFDDSEIAQRDPILMTSVHQDAQRLAQLGVERAQQLIFPSSPPSEPQGTLVPTHLVVRGTTGKVLAS